MARHRWPGGARGRWLLRAAVIAALCAALACCTGPPPQRAAGGRGAPAAGALLAQPGRLVDRPVASSGCGRRPGVRPGTTARLAVAVPPADAGGARQRFFWLHVPAGYSPRRRTPLVLAFHGAGGTGTGMERTTGLSGLADTRGFLVAYPQGLRIANTHGPTGWADSGPRDPEAGGVDDGLFASDVLNLVQAGYCVDPARIAATGFSNGGGMMGYLACALAGRIAAFAPVEGEFFQIPGGCRPARPASVLDVHVVTDPAAPYAGVPARGSPDYYALAIPAWLGGWAARDHCRGGPGTFLRTPQVTGIEWRACPGGVAVAGYRRAGGGHSWPAALGGVTGSQAIISFFAAHPLRPVTGSAARPAAGPPAPVLAAPAPAVGSTRQFRVPTPGAEPFDIAAGPGGDLWFTEFHAGKIGRITPAGTISEFRVPTAGAGPYQITAGPGGSMWFTEYNATKIGRVTGRGAVTEFRVPGPSYGGNGITAVPGGPVWAADGAGYLDRIGAAGTITRIRLPRGSEIPFAIAARAGGTLWFSELTGYFEYSRVLAQLRAGANAVTPALTLQNRDANIDALAAGPGGTLWFTDFGANQVGEVTAGGRLRLFTVPAPYSGLNDITMGPDGAMWFTGLAGLLGRVTSSGSISELGLPPGSAPDGVAAGPGRTLWVAEPGADSILRITLPHPGFGP